MFLSGLYTLYFSVLVSLSYLRVLGHHDHAIVPAPLMIGCLISENFSSIPEILSFFLFFPLGLSCLLVMLFYLSHWAFDFQWFYFCSCWSEKIPSQSQVFAHLVHSWQCCLGILWSLLVVQPAWRKYITGDGY